MRSIFVIIALLAFAACHKESKPAPSKRAKREETMVQASREQQATNAFVLALRSVIEWRQTHPQANAAEVLKQLEQVSVSDAPDDLAKPWQTLLAAARSASDPALTSAINAMNQAMAARGYIDVQL